MAGGCLVSLAVDISRDLELLNRLKFHLGAVGVHAEVREHLMSLVVFPAPPALPVCVFVSGGGQFYSWHGSQRQLPATDIMHAAKELVAVVLHHPCQQQTEIESSGR
jgi:hypothetical protein